MASRPLTNTASGSHRGGASGESDIDAEQSATSVPGVAPDKLAAYAAALDEKWETSSWANWSPDDRAGYAAALDQLAVEALPLSSDELAAELDQAAAYGSFAQLAAESAVPPPDSPGYDSAKADALRPGWAPLGSIPGAPGVSDEQEGDAP